MIAETPRERFLDQLKISGGDRLKSEAGHALRHAKRTGTHVARSEGALQARFQRSLASTATDRTQIPVVPVVQPIIGI